MEQLRQILTHKLQLLCRHNSPSSPQLTPTYQVLLSESKKQSSRQFVQNRLLQAISSRRIQAPYRIQQFYNESLAMMQLYEPFFDFQNNMGWRVCQSVDDVVTLYVRFFRKMGCPRAEQISDIWAKGLCEKGLIVGMLLHWFCEWLRKEFKQFLKKSLANHPTKKKMPLHKQSLLALGVQIASSSKQKQEENCCANIENQQPTSRTQFPSLPDKSQFRFKSLCKLKVYNNSDPDAVAFCREVTYEKGKVNEEKDREKEKGNKLHLTTIKEQLLPIKEETPIVSTEPMQQQLLRCTRRELSMPSMILSQSNPTTVRDSVMSMIGKKPSMPSRQSGTSQMQIQQSMITGYRLLPPRQKPLQTLPPPRQKSPPLPTLVGRQKPISTQKATPSMPSALILPNSKSVMAQRGTSTASTSVNFNREMFFSSFFEEVNMYYRLVGVGDEGHPRGFRKVDRRQQIRNNLGVLVQGLVRKQPATIRDTIHSYYADYSHKFTIETKKKPQTFERKSIPRRCQSLLVPQTKSNLASPSSHNLIIEYPHRHSTSQFLTTDTTVPSSQKSSLPASSLPNYLPASQPKLETSQPPSLSSSSQPSLGSSLVAPRLGSSVAPSIPLVPVYNPSPPSIPSPWHSPIETQLIPIHNRCRNNVRMSAQIYEEFRKLSRIFKNTSCQQFLNFDVINDRKASKQKIKRPGLRNKEKNKTKDKQKQRASGENEKVSSSNSIKNENKNANSANNKDWNMKQNMEKYLKRNEIFGKMQIGGILRFPRVSGN